METKKLNFKAGDIVKVMPYEWYDFFKDKDGNVMPKDVGVEGAKHYFTKEMAKWCGTYFEIIDLIDGGYKVYGMDQIFEDWMVENKKFNRTQNKIEKSMETKKMTIAEAQQLVRNTKYIVWSEDESRALQKKLFEFGCRWLHSGKSICHAEHPFLTVDENLNIRYREKNQYMHFEEEKNRFTETHHILDIEIEIEQEPKPKFDPKTLEVYDKVLVRESQNQVWKAKFFHCKKGGQFYMIDDVVYNFCIPFNDETKHLHRTSNEAPEFYKLD